MEKVIKTLLKQGYLIEPNLIPLLSHESLSSIPIIDIVLNLNPPKLISKTFFLTNIPNLIKKINDYFTPILLF